MIPQNLRALFWDVDPEQFEPRSWPGYSILRVLEYGDDVAVRWMRELFPEAEIKRVICTERRLSAKSANYWALMYGISPKDVAALDGGDTQGVAP